MPRNLTTVEEEAVSRTATLRKALQRAEISLQRQYSNAHLAQAIEDAIEISGDTTAEALAMKAAVLELRAEATAQMHGAASFADFLTRRWKNNAQLMAELI